MTGSAMASDPSPHPIHPGIHNATNFQLAPGETMVYGDTFSPTLLTPYLKTQLMCSSTRFAFESPNTILGFIPVGGSKSSFPINGISSVSTSTQFRLGQFLLSVILVVLGIALMGGNSLPGVLFCVFLVLLGAVGISGSFPAGLIVQNHAGATTVIVVSPFERAKLARFTAEMQQLLFANQSQIHHQEAQQLHTQQLMMQQLALQQQMSTAQQQAFYQMQVAQQQPGQALPQPPAAPQAPLPPVDGEGTQQLPTTE
ncbi:hypothetical protein ACSL103130_09965 [Actinomyces slackii]|uniref:Uncharacterized protein n=1 Tax=Actinomyces slackii TaxID=52774 RepID=A0A448K9G8_9ACTO|nr:hypothetical protein [Actinomyces slackii]VEG73628.1 Uncharacterised protein [Actinomyces slackii]